MSFDSHILPRCKARHLPAYSVDGLAPWLAPLLQPGDEMPVPGEGQSELGAAELGLFPVARDLVQQDVDVRMSFHGGQKIMQNCALSIIADLLTVRRIAEMARC